MGRMRFLRRWSEIRRCPAVTGVLEVKLEKTPRAVWKGIKAAPPPVRGGRGGGSVPEDRYRNCGYLIRITFIRLSKLFAFIWMM
jgi:hypothetical protein